MFEKIAPLMTEKLLQDILKLAVEIQQIPAPTFEEQQRASFVEKIFYELGLQCVEQDDISNVFAKRPGGAGRPILISAHLDTVFPMDTDLTCTHEKGRISGPGIGDNSLSVAALVGLIWVLDKANVTLPGDLWLVANVGEEGLGDLLGMRKVVKRFGDQVAAYVVLEGMSLGALTHKGIGSRRYQVFAQAPGGHSWGDFGQTSAIHTLVRLADELTRLQVPATPKTTFNIGVIEGGTSVNTIAETASLQLDLRSESSEELERLILQFENVLAAFDAEDGTIEADVIGDRPSGTLAETHPLVRLAETALDETGILLTDKDASSTDANVPLALGYPAICIGLTRGNNAHRMSEYIETEPFAKGFEQLIRLMCALSEAASRDRL